jgi:WD40 repeat protein
MSPDGRYKVVKWDFQEIRMGSPLFGRIEIQGSNCGLVDGEFAEQFAFSNDSRFLAAAKLGDTRLGPHIQVIVFDLAQGSRTSVFDHYGLIHDIQWEPDGYLSIATWTHLDGEKHLSRIWNSQKK